MSRALYPRAVVYSLCAALLACAPPAADSTDASLDETADPLTGQAGALAITTAATVVNQYGVLAASVAAGATSITITSAGDFTATAPFTTALAAGDLLMLYQPGGATIDATLGPSYGNVTALGGAGSYELVHVASVAGTTVALETSCGGLKSAYTTAGATEVIRVPQVTTLTISGTGSLTAAPWDGARGGVLAIQAQTTATIGGAGIDVTGKGFRGGAADNQTTGPPGTTVIASTSAAAGAEKGESIAGYQAVYDTVDAGRYGRGAPANGGGGGDAHNAGGGGGANGNNGNAWTGAGVMDITVTGGALAWPLDPEYASNGNKPTTSAGGGRGGYTYSDANKDATTDGPGNADWAGDSRRDFGGLGGRPLTADPASHVYFGGGGGAGDGNNGAAGAGGAGGGLVVLLASTVTGTAAITANGAVGINSNGNPGDAPGGAGAGGTILIGAKSLAGIAAHADGGAGGKETNEANPEAEGPGGGGGGGFIATAGGTITATAVGGVAGTTNSPALTEFPVDGATVGATGQTGIAFATQPVCLADDLEITVDDGTTTATPGSTTTYAITVTNLGADVATGATVTDVFTAAITGVSWTCTASTGSTCPAAAGTGNINALVTLAPNNGTVTYTAIATIASTATGTLTNTGSVTAPASITDPTAGNNSASDSDTLTASADLSVTVTAPSPVAPGATETYTVTPHNAGPSASGATTVSDTLPPGSTFTSAIGAGWACTSAGLVVTCTRTTMAVGDAPITIVSKAPATSGPATDNVSVAATTDPNATNNTGSVTVTVTGNADLAVSTLTATPNPVTAGALMTFTIVVTNNGAGTAGAVSLDDALPPGSTFQSVSTTGWTCAQSGVDVICTLPTLAQTTAPTITITALGPAAGGSVNDVATVSSTTPDPLTANNMKTVTTQVTASADLAVGVTAAPEPVTAGGALTYTVAVTNHGPSPAASVTVTDTLPTGVGFVSATGTGWTCLDVMQVVSCTAASLAAGAAPAPAITIVTTAPTEPGMITDTVAVASATTADPATANNSAQVISNVGASADLAVAITASPDPVAPGSTLTYAVAVTNNGPSTADTVTVSDALPVGATFVSATGTGWTCTQAAGVVTCTAPSLIAGAAPVITIVATAPIATGTLTDSATVSATTGDPDSSNNSTSITSADSASAGTVDLAVAITGTPDPVAAGGTETYAIAVSDLSTTPATMVTVTDVLPAGVTFVSAIGDGWTCAASAGTVTCTRPELDAGATSTITLVVSAPTGGGPLTDTVSVRSASPDPVMSNNTASVTVTVTGGGSGSGIGDDPIGVRGGGCSAGGDPASSTALLVSVLAFGLRRRRGALAAAAATAVALLTPGIAHAQLAGTTQSFPVERMRVALDRDGIIGVEWGGGLERLSWNIGTWVGYANDPLVVYDEKTNDRVGSLVHNRYGGGVFGAVGITRWLELGVDLPLIYDQNNAISIETLPSPDSPRLGDLRLVPKLILRGGKDRINVAVELAFTLPTAGSAGYAGDSGPTFTPEVIVSRAFGPLRLAANADYIARKTEVVDNLRVDDEIDVRVGAGYRFGAAELDAMFSAATPAGAPFSHINTDPAEVDLAAQYDVYRGVTIFAGGGEGIGAGFGSPDWRLFAGVRYSHTPARPEPTVAPEPVAVVPAPPAPPPDRDSDGDGLLDSVDKCPAEPEDKDGFQDADGCPDPDNDNDGVLDAVDQCPNEPGPADNHGCPDPDRDGDGIPDRLDNCPDEPGTAENHGCAAKQLVTITNGKIELLDAVYFRTDRDVIEARSFAILNNVAKVLAAHPEIASVRVEGHTDNRGGEKHNQDLSQRRAAAVVKYLVGKKVPRDRLVPTGFGQSRPIQDNGTDAGRAANRRVEFVIVGGDADVNVKATGPTDETIGK